LNIIEDLHDKNLLGAPEASGLSITIRFYIICAATEVKMKLSRSTTILLNVALILAIGFLVKSLISFPKSLYAQMSNAEYSVESLNLRPGESADTGSISSLLNAKAKEGWKYHSVVGGNYIFER
jgi:hypothetical protein